MLNATILLANRRAFVKVFTTKKGHEVFRYVVVVVIPTVVALKEQLVALNEKAVPNTTHMLYLVCRNKKMCLYGCVC